MHTLQHKTKFHFEEENLFPIAFASIAKRSHLNEEIFFVITRRQYRSKSIKNLSVCISENLSGKSMRMLCYSFSGCLVVVFL